MKDLDSKVMAGQSAVDVLSIRETAGAAKKGPELHIGSFAGPLDLLCHLIEKNKIDIYDIPISFITTQYMAYMENLDVLDMDLVSDFLLMASTLLQIKSAMLLPLLRPAEENDEEDPRDELVFKLLAYRRARLLASEIARRQQLWTGAAFHLPETAKRLGIDVKVEAIGKELDFDKFLLGAERVGTRNRARYQDLASKMSQILQREKVSLRDKLSGIWSSLKRKGKLYFTELFPYGASKQEKVVGFLAVLELLKSNRIYAKQDHPGDVIELSYNPESDAEDNQTFLSFINDGKVEEEYD